ncbi:penicillin-binding protein [Staphylococcus massiliensis]|uniref:Penicillin-binding protein 1 n=1 Tax=Staphylococcus massiliensis S46 TaxID=1229783 RepID=K9ASX6_9STAP|nr:penicillin-binding protein [Staphylococcus massiliensis]EKU50379.1 penicillin-binding protein 1 [Staphylococcus massiliensis S46]PNZ99737.1 PASTA domain-containing protein [Staphylococcus massiliensis CCUG 55927]
MAKRKIKIKKNKIGAVLLIGIFGLLFFLLVFRYGFIMLTGHSSGQDLIMKANEKYLTQKEQEPERGKIYDRNGKILAEDVERFKLVAVVDKKASEGSDKPRHVVNTKEAAKKLSEVIDMEEKEIKKRLDNKKAFQVEFGQKGKNLTFQDKEKIEKMHIPGVSLLPETHRFYPNGKFASHLIGKASKDPETGEINGALGIEKVFDSYLSGKKGNLSFTRDIWGYITPNSKREKQPERGDDVHLTIDSNIQVFVERALDDMVNRYQPKDIFAVVMDADTGEILAYSQRPTFNPETGEGFGKKWQNDLFQETYEPGSTFKVFGLAAAIQEGKFKPDEKYDSGSMEINGHKIYDWNKEGWGKITMKEGFMYSSNVLMMKLQDLVGADKMQSWYEKFGFGKKTDSVFDSEPEGNIAWEDELQQKTSAFGQSSTVTPIQMIQAQSAVLNKGNMLKPFIVNKVTNPIKDETYFNQGKKVIGKPITEETADKTMKQLDNVVNNEKAEAKNYRVDGYDIAGKTGTAQVSDPENGGYVEGDNPYFVSFIGHAPSKDPEILIYSGMSLAQQNDQEAYEMGVSKLFKPVMKNTLQYLNVGNKQDEANEPHYKKVPSVAGQSVQKAQDTLKGQGVNATVIGGGDKIEKQVPEGDTKLLPNSNVMLMTNKDLTMPNMKGWTKEQLVAFEQLTGIHVKTKGSGYVSDQSISQGQILKDDAKIEVKLEAPNTNGKSDE